MFAVLESRALTTAVPFLSRNVRASGLRASPTGRVQLRTRTERNMLGTTRPASMTERVSDANYLELHELCRFHLIQIASCSRSDGDGTRCWVGTAYSTAFC